MSNVLPQEVQRAVWSTYRARFIIAGSLVVIIAAALAALALLPSFLALRSVPVPSVNAAPTAPNASDRDQINRTQSLLAELTPLVSATTSPVDIVSRALALRPSGVTVDHITYTSGHPSVIMLVGSAAAPSEIDAFRAALAAEPRFTSVSVPVNDLVGAGGGRFSITISGNF
jgi:hypothetical protein